MKLSLDKWVSKVLSNPLLCCMGHAQIPTDDLGLGWLYYSLARVYKPKTAVVIGSFRGFVPLMIGRALQDNGAGKVVFIDPSFADDFWMDPVKVKAHFRKFGLSNIEHFPMTTQRFKVRVRFDFRSGVGMLFIDGYHSHKQAKFDYEAFKPLMTPRGIALFHDSIAIQKSIVYGEENAYDHHVVDYMAELKKDQTLQVFEVPIGSGVTLVRKRGKPEKLFDEAAHRKVCLMKIKR